MSDNIILVPWDEARELAVVVGRPALTGAFTVVVTVLPREEEETVDLEITMPHGSSVVGTAKLLELIGNAILSIRVSSVDAEQPEL